MKASIRTRRFTPSTPDSITIENRACTEELTAFLEQYENDRVDENDLRVSAFRNALRVLTQAQNRRLQGKPGSLNDELE